jgi:hypothetical protein
MYRPTIDEMAKAERRHGEGDMINAEFGLSDFFSFIPPEKKMNLHKTSKKKLTANS